MENFEESPKEECGVIGIFAPNEDVARMTFFGLYALSTRTGSGGDGGGGWTGDGDA